MQIAPLVLSAIRSADFRSRSGMRSVEQEMADWAATPRAFMLLLGGFAIAALLLAALGIYGVTSYVVSQRTREIGIRMALGALRRDVVAEVVRQGMALKIVGVVAGWICAAGATRVLTSLLYGVSPTDPRVFGLVALTLVSVAALACFIPARRAARVDPVIALRSE